MRPLVQILQEIKYDIRKLEDYNEIVIKTAKKDRIISIKKILPNIIINEKGYENQELSFMQEDEKVYLKLLKTMIKREFPRSKRVWFSYHKIA